MSYGSVAQLGSRLVQGGKVSALSLTMTTATATTMMQNRLKVASIFFCCMSCRVVPQQQQRHCLPYLVYKFEPKPK